MFEKGLDLIGPYLYKRSVAYPALAVLGAFVWYTISIGPHANEQYIAYGLPLATVAGGLALHWAFTRIPAVPAGAIGIAIALRAEDEVERILLKNDFIRVVRSVLGAESPERPFQVVVLNRFQAEEIDTIEAGTRLLDQARASFVVFGDLRKRTDSGKSVHVLRLTCIVRHAFVDASTQKQLAAEMAHLLPPKIKFECENDLRGFDLSSAQIASGAKLTIASAALLSGELRLARSVLEGLYAQIGALRKHAAEFGNNKLPELVERRLWNCHLAESRGHYARWRVTRNRDDLQAAEAALERANEFVPNTADYFVAKAICHFVLRRDMAAANAALDTLKGLAPDDATWRYSKAFLAAYSGNLQAAWKLYRDALHAKDKPETPVEVEEFMMWILEVEPDRFQLHYCLGIVNMLHKGDPAQAVTDFERFLEKCPQGEYPENRKAAEGYRRRLRDQLGSDGQVTT